MMCLTESLLNTSESFCSLRALWNSIEPADPGVKFILNRQVLKTTGTLSVLSSANSFFLNSFFLEEACSS